MKLLVCKSCYDVVKLPMGAFRPCACGRSKAMYRADGVGALYAGPAIIVGVSNGEFEAMLRSASMGDLAHRPEMFVIPEGHHVDRLR